MFQCLKETGIHRFRLVFVLATIASMLCLPLWLYWDLPQILADTSLVSVFLSKLNVNMILKRFQSADHM